MTLLEKFRSWFDRDNSSATESCFSEERESPRLSATFFVRLGGNGPLIERHGNVGIAGFCFEGERELVSGSRVSLTFLLPGTHDWIHARGLVLGQVQYPGWLGIRGRFTGIGFEEERRLARWLDSQRESPQLATARCRTPAAAA